MVKNWGLAYMINTQDVPGGRSAGSLAWAGLVNTYFWLDPKKKVTGVILTQILPFADQQDPEAAGRLRNRRLPERPHASSAGQGRIVLGPDAEVGSLMRACPAGRSLFASLYWPSRRSRRLCLTRASPPTNSRQRQRELLEIEGHAFGNAPRCRPAPRRRSRSPAMAWISRRLSFPLGRSRRMSISSSSIVGSIHGTSSTMANRGGSARDSRTAA